jgi:hypothetical protein
MVDQPTTSVSNATPPRNIFLKDGTSIHFHKPGHLNERSLLKSDGCKESKEMKQEKKKMDGKPLW